MKPCRDKYREELISQGIPEAKLRALEVNCETKIGKLITHLPRDGGKFHPQIVKIFDAREKSIDEGKGIDWGTAEALAFATLID